MANAALARETLCALRQTIARIEMGQNHTETLEKASEASRLPLGVEAFDQLLDGGLSLYGLNEIRSSLTMESGAATGFALALSTLIRQRQESDRFILWIGESLTAREAGYPHAGGLLNFGFDPSALIYTMPRKLEDALWICEAALEVNAFAAVILEVRGNPVRFGLTESRRLHLRARTSRMPLLLLRQAGEEEASSAQTRICVKPAMATNRFRRDGVPMEETIGNPCFEIIIEKSRNPAPVRIFMEWNANECQFYPASPKPIKSPHPQWTAHSGTSLPTSFERPPRPQEMGSVVAFERAS